jgi:Tol biopolymer transport system component
MNADGSRQTRLTHAPDNDYAPSWSPDGKKIAFDRDLGGVNFDLYVINADGSGEKKLASGPAADKTLPGRPMASRLPSSATGPAAATSTS